MRATRQKSIVLLVKLNLLLGHTRLVLFYSFYKEKQDFVCADPVLDRWAAVITFTTPAISDSLAPLMLV